MIRAKKSKPSLSANLTIRGGKNHRYQEDNQAEVGYGAGVDNPLYLQKDIEMKPTINKEKW